jgi:hypothetical protein
MPTFTLVWHNEAVGLRRDKWNISSAYKCCSRTAKLVRGRRCSGDLPGPWRLREILKLNG